MWLFTTSGFISIIEKDANHLAVRARDSLSLSPLAQSYDVEIRSTPLRITHIEYLLQRISLRTGYQISLVRFNIKTLSQR